MIGQYWDRAIPMELYPLKYFKFKRAFGGHANDGPELKFIMEIPQLEAFLEQFKILYEKYPYAPNSGFRKGKNTLEIGINEYQYLDYDFLFAQLIETLVEQFEFKMMDEFIADKPAEYHSFCGIKRRSMPWFQLNRDFLYLTIVDWKGLESSNMAVFSPMVNHQPENTASLLQALQELAIQCAFQILWVEKSFHRGKDLLSLYATNGRLGLNFAPLHSSNLERYQQGIIHLFSKYDLVSSIQTNSAYGDLGFYASKEGFKLIGDIDRLF